MRVFITGICGFVGSHLADALIAEGHEVTGNDNLICGDAENFKKYAHVDCCDYEAMRKVLGEFKPDVVVHAACTAHEGFSPYSPHAITSSTYGGSVSTFSAAIGAGVKRIVFMSTMARYGKQEPPFTELTPPAPCDPYGIAKVAAEDTLKNLCEVHGVKWSIACPHNLIAVRQKYDDPFRNVCSIFINRMLQGKPAVVYGDGEQTRCFSPIGDALPSLIKMIYGEADGEILNIGPDSPENTMTINELASRIGSFTGFNGLPEYYPERGCDAKHATCSSDKARKLLGFEAKYSVDECLREMVEDVKRKGTKPFDYFMEVEIDNPNAPRTWKDRLI